MSENQHPKASGKDLRSTLYKKGRDPPDDSLDDIAKNLISYFKEFSLFEQYEKEIEKKYDVKKEHDDCWPVDDIKRAWGKTQRMYETSERRKCWSLAVMVQMMKRSSFDESKRQKAQSDPNEVSALPACGETQSKRRGPPADRDRQQNTNIVEQNHISDNGETRSKRRGPPADRDSLETKRKERNIKESNINDMEQNNINNDGPVYIHVPFSEMFGHKSSFSFKEISMGDSVPIKSLPYKLKDKAPSFTELTKKTSYVMLYDNRTRNAAWVYELLNKSIVEENKKNKHLKGSRFKVDDSIPKPFQTPEGKKTLEKPFERGHLAPARNHRSSQRAQDDTYLLSNISPQCSRLNRGIWKRLENLCVEIAKEKEDRNVHVYTGPLYVPAGKHSHHVEYEFVGGKAVPTHFFKVIIVEERDGTVLQPTCYKILNYQKLPKNQQKIWEKVSNKKLPNEVKLAVFEVDIEDIESESGLIFTDRRCKEQMIDRILTVTLKAGNGNKNPDPQKLPKKQLKCGEKVSKKKLQKDKSAESEVDIERESGLIFTDHRREEGAIDRILTVKGNTNPDPLTCRSEIRVRISTALSDPAGI